MKPERLGSEAAPSIAADTWKPMACAASEAPSRWGGAGGEEGADADDTEESARKEAGEEVAAAGAEEDEGYRILVETKLLPHSRPCRTYECVGRRPRLTNPIYAIKSSIIRTTSRRKDVRGASATVYGAFRLREPDQPEPVQEHANKKPEGFPP